MRPAPRSPRLGYWVSFTPEIGGDGLLNAEGAEAAEERNGVRVGPTSPMKLPHYPSLALVLAVAVYFAIGCTLSLEYIDEGQIISPSWLVSLGALPYRDFRHLYGPALFALNGALLRWVATDLLVIRISLVAVKTDRN